ncbi:MAG: polyphosphate kinase 1 [Rhodothermales bacterium]
MEEMETSYSLVDVVPTSTAPRVVPQRVTLDDARLYFNREMSWLDFNWRVLYQARDCRVPVLERARFLSIAATNLDEFFRKRIGGLKRQAAAGVDRPSPDGRSPQDQLQLAREATARMAVALADAWERELRPTLATVAQVRVTDFEDLDDDGKMYVCHWFQQHIFPILTPLAVDPGHPFPFISNLSLSLAVTLRHPTRHTEHFARLKVPTSRGRFVPLPDGETFVPIEQVISNNIGDLFRGMQVIGVHAFRITRNADIERDEEEADDLIAMISDELRERRFAPIVRLEVDANMPRDVVDLLKRELNLTEADTYRSNGALDLGSVGALANVPRPGHQYEHWEPVVPTRLLHEGEAKDRLDMFEIIRRADLMVHHPYESFTSSVLRFLDEAADDAHVVAIKQTLYRTSDESPIVKALIRAAEKGKQVAVLVEVKARFDEKNNIEWGQKLEESGVHVTYGLVGLKTHSKTTLVIREEADGLRTYCHIGTGNYNPTTARLYTDTGLFTCAPDIGRDMINLFHYLTGYAPEQHYLRLIVAPREMRRHFIDLVHAEVAHHKAHGNGRIIAKMNALDDLVMIRELYRASQAGVQVDLIVRGHCRLRPGLKRYSENIRVVSIIGRFLEHSRVYYFQNNNHPRVFIGSADWQRRNLEDRVEVVVEIDDASIRARFIRSLQLALSDPASAWELQSDGRWLLRMPEDPDAPIHGFQQVLMERARSRTEQADSPWDIGPAA